MILTIVVLLVFMVMISAPIISHQRRSAHDLRHLAIYNNVVDRVVDQALRGDMPRDEALIILNAARETYNESVRGRRRIQEVRFPEVHRDEAVGDSPRNETSSEGQKSERKKSGRPTRPDLDSNP